ncbi:MAG: diphthine--ammonia ligase [Flavobacteriaceae bacterium]
MKLLSSWSGGKDSCFALMKAVEAGGEVMVLLNMMNENGKISRSHGIPLAVLKQQAQAINVPLETCQATWANYEQEFIATLQNLTKTYKLQAAVFGDIDIQSHRDWEEKVCAAAELKAQLPLWQGERKQLVIDMINAGVKAIIVSCNTDLGLEFLGREINIELLEELERIGVDCCGENGEYHTLVVDCPLFKEPVKLPEYAKVKHENYCFLDWN